MATSARPTDGPLPVITFSTPSGIPASVTSFASSSAVTGVWSLGLTTIVHPAASAGASFQLSSSSGEFHGPIAATTPTGSRNVNTTRFGCAGGSVSPLSLSARPEGSLRGALARAGSGPGGATAPMAG